MKLFLFFVFVSIITAFPEQGHYEFTEKLPFIKHIEKSMYKNTHLNIKVSCSSKNDLPLIIDVNALNSHCFNITNPPPPVRSIKQNFKCLPNTYINIMENTSNQITYQNFPKYFGNDSNNYLTTAHDGIYYFMLSFNAPKNIPVEKISVVVDLRTDSGYLSAKDWPLLMFYSVMCGVYAVLAFSWLVLSCCNWRDLLRIQFWIGAVIVLGMVEKAMFVAEYQVIDRTGVPLRYPVMFAEIVSCLKRMLARILLMIICIGYGIVKQRLGPAMRKIIGVGLAYLVAALVEGYFRVFKPSLVNSTYTFVPDVVLVALDSLILWWSFMYLIGTIKQMRVKHNVVKFNLYRHFSNILIIVVIASVVFMMWALYTFRSGQCIPHWKEIWLNEVYWHILFSIVLLTIVVLWRPSKNSQRYAYSPLLDAEDDMDDSDDIIMDNLTSGELRKPNKNSQQHTINGHQHKDRDKKSVEDDLKWIEDNIPTSSLEKIYAGDSDNDANANQSVANKTNSGKID